MSTSPLSIALAGGESVAAIADAPAAPRFVYVLAHGAGAGMRHAFLEEFAALMVARDVAVLRYNFPYMEAGRNRVDGPEVAVGTVRAACEQAAALWPGMPIVAGGKSFGGRMTSEAQSRSPLPGVRGLAFLGFPLHPPDKPGITRAEHLGHVHVPMLFLQGDRDEFAQLPLLRQVIETLPTATLELIPDGDHSFKVRKKLTGMSSVQVMEQLADHLATWAQALAT